MKLQHIAVGIGILAGIAGCAETPMGPMVQVLPQNGKPFGQFQEDQVLCKSYAQQQVAGQAEHVNERAVIGTLITTALGAGIGGAIGGGSGAGVGAAIGGTAGAAGATVGSNNNNVPIQQQYDNAYAQCMYSKGNQVIGNAASSVVVAPAPVVVSQPPTVYSQPAK